MQAIELIFRQSLIALTIVGVVIMRWIYLIIRSIEERHW